MGRYVVRRLLQFVPTLFGALFLLHYLTSLSIQLTGNPVRALFGDRTPSPAQLEALTRVMGLADPCLRQVGNPCLGLFAARLQGMAHGDFGMDLRYRPVTDIIGAAIPYTLELTLIAFLVEVVVGVGLGVLAGVRGGGVVDHGIKIATVLFVSIPIFVLAYVVQLVVGVGIGRPVRESGWAPGWLGAVLSPAYKPEHPIASMLLPGVVLGVLGLAATARLTRTNLMENLRAEYVRTARAKGLAPRRVVWVHTLRNSLVPVVTNLGLTLGSLLGGAVVVESIFNVPGIGREIQRALFRGEPSVVLGTVTILVLSYLVVNLIVDVLYAVIDPRIRQ